MAANLGDIIPAPLSVDPDPGGDFTIDSATVIARSGGSEAASVGDWLAELLRHGTGFALGDTLTTCRFRLHCFH